MSKIPEKFQFPNIYVVNLCNVNPSALAVFINLLAILKLPSKSKDVLDRMTVDITRLKSQYNDSTIKAFLKHIRYLSDSNYIKQVGTRKSNLFYINPVVYNKFTKLQYEIYKSRYNDIHMFSEPNPYNFK